MLVNNLKSGSFETEIVWTLVHPHCILSAANLILPGCESDHENGLVGLDLVQTRNGLKINYFLKANFCRAKRNTCTLTIGLITLYSNVPKSGFSDIRFSA